MGICASLAARLHTDIDIVFFVLYLFLWQINLFLSLFLSHEDATRQTGPVEFQL